MMNLQRMADATGLTLAECRHHRIDYLKRHVAERTADARWLADQGDELSARMALDVYAEIQPEARELIYLTRQQRGYRPPLNEITPEMIQAARDYPITSLIEFDGKGHATAWCHQDNHPSLTLWKGHNKATCFPCGASYGPIDVLMSRDGMSFPDAVRGLAA